MSGRPLVKYGDWKVMASLNHRRKLMPLMCQQLFPGQILYVVEGWPKYVDQNKDNKITIGQTLSDPGDAKIIGNSQARYRFGVNLDADWNGFDFSVFLQGVAKQDFYPHHYLFWGPYQQPYAGIYSWNLDYYRATSQTEAERAVNSASFNDAGLADANTDSYFPVLQSWLADNNYRGSRRVGKIWFGYASDKIPVKRSLPAG